MAVLGDADGSGVGGIASDAEATAIFLNGEPTIYAFAEDVVEQATRYYYEAADSGVVFTLVVSGEAQKHPSLIGTVARQLAATWNENAKVPGVQEIDASAQDTTPLGFLVDVANVAVTSTSGKNGGILTVRDQEHRPDVFAEIVAEFRAQLDAVEQG